MLHELHLTVDGETPAWEAFCLRLVGVGGAKPLLIELRADRPARPLQLMFAATHDGNGATAANWAWQLEAACRTGGFPVLRRKLEVPLDKSAGLDVLYYECHVKALLRQGEVAGAVRRAEALGWAASRNLLRPQDDGLEKWYFTLRARGMGYRDAAVAFQAGFVALGWAPGDFVALRMESEAVVEDSDEAFDAGWIPRL